jgi:hypothetical protein
MSILRIGRLGVLLSAAALAACGGGNNNNVAGGSTSSSAGAGGAGAGGAGVGGAGTGGAVTSTFTPASHPALPQVIKFTNSVLTKPKLQPIRYSTDVNADDLDKFFQELATTAYWGDVTSEYGVGALTVLPTIVRTDTAPATVTDDQIQEDISTNTTGSTAPPWGLADPGTIYLMLMPAGTIVTQGGGTGCMDFDGYHDETPVTTAVRVPYAVGCSCHGFDGPSITDLQERTVAISHELVEASTDPFPNSDPAYAQEDDADIVWSLDTGGELADMCEFNTDSYAVPPGSKYMVQRSWSNKAAKASTNPCVPVLTTEPYFNAVPALPDMLTISGGGPSITTPGVKIAVGASKTIDVTLFSDAPTSGPWKVSVYDMSPFLGGPSQLDLSLDKTSGKNGDTLHLTIKVIAADTQFGVESFALFSDLGGAENMWLGTVGQ